MKQAIENIKKKLDGLGYTWDVQLIGQRDGLDVYRAVVPDAHTGYPFVYLCDGPEIKKEIQGPEALEIVVEFVKE